MRVCKTAVVAFTQRLHGGYANDLSAFLPTAQPTMRHWVEAMRRRRRMEGQQPAARPPGEAACGVCLCASKTCGIDLARGLEPCPWDERLFCCLLLLPHAAQAHISAAAPALRRPGSAAGRQGNNDQRTYFPPASAGHNNYTLLKWAGLLVCANCGRFFASARRPDAACCAAVSQQPLSQPECLGQHAPATLPLLSRFYRLSSELVRAVVLGLDENGVDFSFRCALSAICRLAHFVYSPRDA